MAAPATDSDLIQLMEHMRFEHDPRLAHAHRKVEMIRYFEETYGDTAQDTVEYAAEFVIVVRNILNGRRPRKLVFLTDFDGEEK